MAFGHLPELMMVLIFALIFFGPKRLPEIGVGLGKSMREFRQAMSEAQDVASRTTRSEVEDVAYRAGSEVREVAHETKGLLSPARQQVMDGHAVAASAWHQARATEAVAAPAPGDDEPSRT
jgi:TatA/E family protein of Tat protein translocase